VSIVQSRSVTSRPVISVRSGLVDFYDPGKGDSMVMRPLSSLKRTF
jgi:hypothetical protein